MACATPTCTAPGSLLVTPVVEEGAAPLTAQAVSCAPAFAPSALCTAGTVAADPTYLSVAGLGFNLSQDTAIDAGDAALTGITIAKSLTVTIQRSESVGESSSLRVELTDSNNHYYCAYEGRWTSGAAIPISQFNTKCWDNTGTFATPSMLFKRVDILVPSKAYADQRFAFCLTDVSLE